MNKNLIRQALPRAVSFLASAVAGLMVSSSIFFAVVGSVAGSIGVHLPADMVVFYLTTAAIVSVVIVAGTYLANYFRPAPIESDSRVIGMSLWIFVFFIQLMIDLVRTPAGSYIDLMWVSSAACVFLLATVIGLASGAAIAETSKWFDKSR